MTQLTYPTYVTARARSNPCIRGLEKYFTQRANLSSKIVYLDLSTHTQTDPVAVEESDLANILSPLVLGTTRILLIEDITPQLIFQLGEILDIDPMFFAEYVDSTFADIEKAPPLPSLAILPSLASSRGYLHLHYQQVLDLGDAELFDGASYALQSCSNIPRNVRRLSSLTGRQLALGRGACSIVIKKSDAHSVCVCSNYVLDHSLTLAGVVLVDRPVRTVIDKESQKSYLAKGLHGGFEDISLPQKISSLMVEKHSWDRNSMIGSILHYFQYQTTIGSSTASPNTLYLAYYPIRIVLSYWNQYMHLVSRYSKYYEYSLQEMSSRLHGNDIIDLQRWRRRIRQSRHKLTILAEFIDFWKHHEDNSVTWKLVERDIAYLQDQLQSYGQSFEHMVTVATSMVQLLDSRQSILEAINVRRLTYIALVFAPLAWVASLFSMSDKYLPGHEGFWIYFVTALPLLTCVFFLSVGYQQIEGICKQICAAFISGSRRTPKRPAPQTGEA